MPACGPCEVCARIVEVRIVGYSGLDLLTLSSSHFDPTETLPAPQCSGLAGPTGRSTGVSTWGAAQAAHWPPTGPWMRGLSSAFVISRKGPAMKLHANAQTCPHCRSVIVSRVMSGQPAASVARDFQVSTKTVHKWIARFRAQ